MGTPEFAVPALELLCEEGYHVALVITQPDRARDRGKKIQFTPVKETALKYGIEVLQPEKVKGNEMLLERIKDLNPDLIVVAAYGKILPKEILEIPRLGCLNIHASLLPKYRGAAPIQRCIMDGEKETGVTLMYMEEGLDTGDMIAKIATPIDKKTAVELHEELAQMGAELLIQTIPDIKKGTITGVKQDDKEACYAPMLFKKDGEIDFTKEPQEIECLVRGLNPWPVAYTTYKGQQMKLWQVEAQDTKTNQPHGMITKVSSDGIAVAAGGGTLLIKKLQMPGKKAMNVGDFLKGNKIEVGVQLGEE